MSTENALLTILVEKINNDTLVLPTLPAIALKVRKSSDDPNINLHSMAEVIGQDPSLSARMIKIANSAYMGRTIKVSSTSQAVTRIGLTQIKNIATALAMEQLFVSKNELVKNYMTRIWDNTVEVVANSTAALRVYTDRTHQRHLNMDTLTLAALVHNIGILPILTEAERHQDVFGNPTFLDVAIDKLAGRIGSSIMRKWGFDEELANVSEHWRDASFKTDKVSYLDFVRLGEALVEQPGEHRDSILKQSIIKGLMTEMSDFEQPDFNQIRDSIKQIFA
jgi:HD-like signal output (HDOD) protein